MSPQLECVTFAPSVSTLAKNLLQACLVLRQKPGQKVAAVKHPQCSSSKAGCELKATVSGTKPEASSLRCWYSGPLHHPHPYPTGAHGAPLTGGRRRASRCSFAEAGGSGAQPCPPHRRCLFPSRAGRSPRWPAAALPTESARISSP